MGVQRWGGWDGGQTPQRGKGKPEQAWYKQARGWHESKGVLRGSEQGRGRYENPRLCERMGERLGW